MQIYADILRRAMHPKEPEPFMQKFETWLATTPFASAVKVFLGIALSLALNAWVQDGVISFDKWQTWVIGALGVAAPILINYFNPVDTRYGKKISE